MNYYVSTWINLPNGVEGKKQLLEWYVHASTEFLDIKFKNVQNNGIRLNHVKWPFM